MASIEKEGPDPDQTAPLPVRPPAQGLSGARGTEGADDAGTAGMDESLFGDNRELDAHQFARSFLGRRLGDYEVIREIGRGSMGIVFEARNDRLERTVALKVLPPSLSVTRTVIQRFLREAQSVARLNHENIVQIYHIGDQDGVYYYAMQYVEGVPLDKALRERRFTPKECATIVAQSARALAFAHEHGIIHRDVKPANIILSYKNRPVLTDFGLARPEKAATLTESGALVGTPIYMSPEQVRGDRAKIDRRTDIYSLGVTFYEMLAGTPPFESDSTQGVLQKIEYQDPRPVRRVRPEAPKDLETICHRAIEKDPAARYQTAMEMALDLERYLNDEPIQTRPTRLTARLAKKLARHKIIAVLGALLGLAAVAIALSLKAGKETQRAQIDAEFSRLLQEAAEQFRSTSYEAAHDLLSRAIALAPQRALGYVERGKIRYKLEDHQAAVADFDQALAIDPTDARARLWRGICRWRFGGPDERELGIEDVNQTLHASPNDPECLLEGSRLCLELAQLSNNAVARDTFINAGYQRLAKLLDLDPDDDDALVTQGLFYEEQGMLEQAHRNYERAIKLNPTNAQAWTLRHATRPESAPVAAGPLDEPAAPQVAPWWTVLGAQGVNWATRQLAVDEQMLDRALDALALWESEPPGGGAEGTPTLDVEELLTAADDLWAGRGRAQSVPLYERALAANPRLVEPNNRLAEHYLTEGRDVERARLHIERALEISPTNPRSLLIALEVYSRLRDRVRLGEIVATIRRYYPAVESLPGFGRALRLLGGPESQESDG